MFSLRRCCIGAALGLSLLSCGPAYARALPIQNANYAITTAGHAKSWSYGSHVTVSKGPLSSGLAQFSLSGPGSPRILKQQLPVASLPAGNYTLYGSYSVTGKVSASVFFFGSVVEHSPGHGGRGKVFTIHSGGPTGLHAFHTTVPFPFAVPSRATLDFNAVWEGGSTPHVYLKNLHGPAAPEIDPQAGAPALALALGGLALMSERRRRAKKAERAD